MKQRIFLSLFASIVFSSLCGQSAIKWIGFKQNQFSIEFPETWKIDTSHLMSTLAIFYSPLDAANDRFKENVNILIQKHHQPDLTLQQYRTISEQQLAGMGVGVNINVSELAEDEGGDYYNLIYTMTSGGVLLKVHSKAYLIKGAVFLITYTATFVDFAKYEKTAEYMFNSLKILAEK